MPLALPLVAAQIEQDLASWEELLADLQATTARLENFDLPGTQLEFVGTQATREQNVSLIASFNLSLENLKSAWDRSGGSAYLGSHGRWAVAEFTEVYQIESNFAEVVEAPFKVVINVYAGGEQNA